MKNVRAISAAMVVAILLALVPCGAAAENAPVLLDGETWSVNQTEGTTGWNCYFNDVFTAGDNVSVVTTDVHTGEKALKIQNDNNTDTTYLYMRLPSFAQSVNYELACYSKVLEADIDGSGFRIGILRSTPSTYPDKLDTQDTLVYGKTHFSKTATATYQKMAASAWYGYSMGNTCLYMELRGSGSVLIDDITLREVGDGLIAGGDFEGFSPFDNALTTRYSLVGVSTATIVTDADASRGQCLEISQNNNSAAYVYIPRVTPLVANTYYRISMDIKCVGASFQPLVNIEFATTVDAAVTGYLSYWRDGSNSYWRPIPQAPGHTAWKTYTWYVMADSSIAAVKRIGFRGNATLRVDNIRIEPVTDTQTAFFDANGGKLTSSTVAKNTPLTAVSALYSPTVAQSAKQIVAIYKLQDNVPTLTSVVLKDGSSAPEAKSVGSTTPFNYTQYVHDITSSQITTPNEAGTYLISAYAWNDLGPLSPLGAKATLTVE